MNKICVKKYSLVLLAMVPFISINSQANCPVFSDGVYVTDDNADSIGKEGVRENIIKIAKGGDSRWTATTFEFSTALIKKSDKLVFNTTIGNALDEKYETLSVRAETQLPSVCTGTGLWVLQATQYYPNEINFFGKPRGKAKKLPEPIRIKLTLQPLEAGVLRISDCKSEVQERGQWRAYSKYDSVDLCLNLKARRLFDIYPYVSGKNGWQGAL
ncbi:hypothetical protein R6242_21790 [Iodobacter sp. CM08]|uniref:hypothetical protein n=1 Tax=Iodobacter sp. CM08 TaxID=3085902 RepID=UPI002981AD4A|nr:hypothetical protein [Iodobacter sp. CM08]MDW5419210.1 hypothetical protein [Iodobacter sp. CM08]